MIGTEYVLEANNIYYTAEAYSNGCCNGNDSSALVLKGVNLTVHSGEVMAILGSKGSGKRALLEVIAQHTGNISRGKILLNGIPLTPNLFKKKCGYVTQNFGFIDGLTVSQTLYYCPTTLHGQSKQSKVRQMLADLALSQVSNKKVEYLNISEKRRLAIGVQLIRDPVMLLLDEPTQELDPLSAYLVISILSNTSKKIGCGILLSLEKPRSDVFPFLDRALFLCLGGVVYSGGTRAMLEYFHGIGFPCPQLENPLMYYLCLSTVDRRSRDRFLESSQQIEALVQRFTREAQSREMLLNPTLGKVPMSSSKFRYYSYGGLLYAKMLASTFSFGYAGMKTMFLRLLILPITFLMLWLFYSNISSGSHIFYSKNGFILNALSFSYATGILVTISIFPAWRLQFIHDQADGLYSGATLLFVYNSVSLPISFISSTLASAIVYPTILNAQNYIDMTFVYLVFAIWTSFVLAEQICILLLLVFKSKVNVVVIVGYIICISITLASGTVRSFKGLQSLLQLQTKATQTRYASQLLHNILYSSNSTDGVDSEYITERLGPSSWDNNMNLAFCSIFALGLAVFNMIIYLFPLPNFILRKFKVKSI